MHWAARHLRIAQNPVVALRYGALHAENVISTEFVLADRHVFSGIMD